MLAASLGVVAMANHPATFVLRSGERVSGELSYKGGTSYTLNGKDYPSNDIALIEFVPGDPSAAELNQIPTVDNNPSEHERHVFVDSRRTGHFREDLPHQRRRQHDHVRSPRGRTAGHFRR